MITETLQLNFRTASGGRTTISVPDPRPDLTDAEVQTIMDTILAGNIFESSGGDLTGILGALIVTRQTKEFNVS